MFYNHDVLLKHKIDMSGPVSPGNQSKLDALRTSAGVRIGKRSNCAEERILIRNPEYTFLFSIAFETEGTKSACGGCALILADESNNIEDLAG
jgi:hypothetical protein